MARAKEHQADTAHRERGLLFEVAVHVDADYAGLWFLLRKARQAAGVRLPTLEERVADVIREAVDGMDQDVNCVWVEEK